MFDWFEFNDGVCVCMLVLFIGMNFDGFVVFWGVECLIVQEVDDMVSFLILEIKESDEVFC